MEPEDYHAICSYECTQGCCLLCEDAYPGCLCFECKCKKCGWYISPEDWNEEKGKCGLVLKWKKDKEKKFKGISRFIDYNKLPINDKKQKQLFDFGGRQ